MEKHKSGFVNIIGRPNVGKSTLMNALVGERMSIITAKPQTTRHRIIGIVNGEDHQVVFSDTPGVITDPNYKMQERMNSFVNETFDDGDIMMLVLEVGEEYPEDSPVLKRLRKTKAPVFLVINKIDTCDDITLIKIIQAWKDRLDFKEIIPISALKKRNTERLFEQILKYLPESLPYYPKDQLTDRPEKFFVSEIIREKILLLYKQEIPYSSEVIVEEFKVDKVKNLVLIRASIIVMRQTQKGIVIGHQGSMIKRLGIEARKDIERFLEQDVFLDLFVKVKDNWRDDDRTLKHFGYE